MIRKNALLLLLLFLSSFVSAQGFSILGIPSELMESANAVILEESYAIDLVSQSNMRIRHEARIAVFNEKADFLASLELYYDKSIQIKNVRMAFYDLNGKRIKKVKMGDFDDYSATGNSTLYSDNRVLYYKNISTTYPYIVTYEYELISQNTAFIPKWSPVSRYGVGVKKSSFSFTYPKGIKIQKLEKNLEAYEVTITESDRTFQYSTKNIPPIKSETLSPDLSKILPSVKLASNKFELAGVRGSADNWAEFGSWMHNELLASRNNLSPETITKIKDLVKGVEDPIERARIIYEFVQNKTRYINIAIGIGGWQPMKTDEVDRLGYGDCKALTFYTKALLDVVDVPSFYTIVYAGDEYKKDIEDDIVCVQGNHAFLCLPTEKDSIWLECTSQKVPFGLKNSFTDDRKVLAITPEGGKIIHTSTNPPESNLQETTARLSIDKNGHISGEAVIKSYGTQYSQHLHRFDGLSPDKLEKRMKNYFSFINNLKFSKLEVKNNKAEQVYEQEVHFTAENYAILQSNSALIIALNALNRISYVPDRVRNRKTPFEILRGFKDTDAYTISIPNDYKIETLPEPIEITNVFGTYNMSITKLDEHSIAYKRSFTVNKGLYTKEQYKEYRKFRKQINKFEKIKIVISKQ